MCCRAIKTKLIWVAVIAYQCPFQNYDQIKKKLRTIRNVSMAQKAYFQQLTRFGNWSGSSLAQTMRSFAEMSLPKLSVFKLKADRTSGKSFIICQSEC